jgi:hypothetical protein
MFAGLSNWGYVRPNADAAEAARTTKEAFI